MFEHTHINTHTHNLRTVLEEFLSGHQAPHIFSNKTNSLQVMGYYLQEKTYISVPRIHIF